LFLIIFLFIEVPFEGLESFYLAKKKAQRILLDIYASDEKARFSFAKTD